MMRNGKLKKNEIELNEQREEEKEEEPGRAAGCRGHSDAEAINYSAALWTERRQPEQM